MTDLRKAAEKALEALEAAITSHGVMLLSDPTIDAWKHKRVDEKLWDSIKTLRQALAQPKWVCCVCGEPEALGIVHSADAPCFHYTKREWVGLTDEDKDDLLKLDNWTDIVESVETKLKEKNT